MVDEQGYTVTQSARGTWRVEDPDGNVYYKTGALWINASTGRTFTAVALGAPKLESAIGRTRARSFAEEFDSEDATTEGPVNERLHPTPPPARAPLDVAGPFLLGWFGGSFLTALFGWFGG